MFNEKELKAALEAQCNEQDKVKPTLTLELKDHLNNISMSQDRIEGLIDVLELRLYGGGNCESEEEPVSATATLAALNGRAKNLSIKLNKLGDKLTYIVDNL